VVANVNVPIDESTHLCCIHVIYMSHIRYETDCLFVLFQMMSKLSGNATPSVSKYSSADSSLPVSSKSNASVTNVLDSDSSVKPSNSKGKFTAKDIAKNPALARLIVSAAKRAKEIQKKEESELERNSQANEVTPSEASNK
jgi:hypothetical protein